MSDIKAIQLTDAFESYKNSARRKLTFLFPTSKINIFVGSNNSGKSRFMRTLAAQKFYRTLPSFVPIDNIKGDVRSILINLQNTFAHNGVGNYDNPKLNPVAEILQITTSFNQVSIDSYTNWLDRFEMWSALTNLQVEELEFSRLSNVLPNLDYFQRLIIAAGEQLKASWLRLDLLTDRDASQPNRVYVPTIRGLRPFDNSHEDHYGVRTTNDYFQGENKTAPEIFTGLTLYNRLKDMLLGENAERILITEYQNFVSKTLFEGKSVALIPSQKQEVVVVRIGNEKDRPIYDLGDGIQSAIILSFLPFVTREPTFFFIEEPEMYLHPGLQRKLLDFFSTRDDHSFFLTTHSNHFLDLTIDIQNVSIFNFKKELGDEEDVTPDFQVESVNKGCQSSLELLGVRNSSVFLVNATIWVEGITDRWYLRKMLNLYIEWLASANELLHRLEEDTHYSFVEYGGANITHWSFLENEDHPIEVDRLCSRAMVIIDNDGNSKLKRKEALQEKLGERLIILPCREVENLLPYSIIKEIVCDYEGDQNLKLPERSYNAYKNKLLGTFIESDMLGGNVNREGGYRAESGTIKYKVKFCEKALTKITYETLPESTQEIIQKLYQFLVKQNYSD